MTGHTNSVAIYNTAQAWKAAAIADGWKVTPTYQNESVETATTLEREGFKATMLTRTNVGNWKYEVSVSVWGPDRLAILPALKYDWSQIQRGLRHCNYCGKDDVDTQRVSFAGRCCGGCLTTQVKQLEYSGWCD